MERESGAFASVSAIKPTALRSATGPSLAGPLVGYLLQLYGFHWDVSYHVEVGRDSFWIPPHWPVYLGVALVLMSGILPIVSGRGRASAASYALGGLALTQVIAAPIDDLWHRLYGLDNTLWSFPHLLFILAGAASVLGLILLLPTEDPPGDGAGLDLLELARDPRLWLLGLFLAGLAFTVLEFRLRIPWPVWEWDYSLFPPLMIGLALFAGLAGLALTERVGAITMVCLAFTVLELLVNVELLALGMRRLPFVPLLLPSALAADLVMWRVRAPLIARLVLASLVFGAIFYAVQYPYSSFARPPWRLATLRDGWLYALLLAPVAAWAGLVLGRTLRWAQPLQVGRERGLEQRRTVVASTRPGR